VSQVWISKVLLGNNDGDKYSLTKVAATYPNLELADLYLEFTVVDRKIFLTHYDRIGALVGSYGSIDVKHYKRAEKLEYEVSDYQ